MKWLFLLIFCFNQSQCVKADGFLEFVKDTVYNLGRFIHYSFKHAVQRIKNIVFGEPKNTAPQTDIFTLKNDTIMRINQPNQYLKKIMNYINFEMLPNKTKSLRIKTYKTKEDLTAELKSNNSGSTVDIFRKNVMQNMLNMKLLNITSQIEKFQTRSKLAELVTQHGCNLMEYEVVTNDGYIITLHRLSEDINDSLVLNKNKNKNKTILLHHGLLGSSADWLLLGRNKSLAYNLFDLGFDVWLFNARGNAYSRKHVYKNIQSAEFWQFTWQEIGWYDLSATIKFIQHVKNNDEAINYIGYSMGSSSLLALLSTFPKYNRYFKIGILIAPLVYMSHTEGPLRFIYSSSINNTLNKGEISPQQHFPKVVNNVTWISNTDADDNYFFYLTGGPPDNYTNYKTKEHSNAKTIAPSGGSMNTMLHYAQLTTTGKFHYFNAANLEFDLNQVYLPMALISSDSDSFSTVVDAQKLYTHLLNPIEHYIIRGKNLTHSGFLWSSKAPLTVFTKVSEILVNDLLDISNTNETETNEIK